MIDEPPKKQKNGYYYTIETVNKARTLRAGGWSYGKIAELLGCHKATVHKWCNPGFQAVQTKYAQRRRDRRRVKALFDAGLAPADIAKVMQLDQGKLWSTQKVGRLLSEAHERETATRSRRRAA